MNIPEFLTPVIIRPSQLNQLLQDAYAKGLEKRKKISIDEKKELVRKIWGFFLSLDKVKSDMQKSKMIDEFFDKLLEDKK